MKKQLALKYPYSASLFRFCRRVLDHRLGGVRVIDQDVGQILGFDPADCSHWKKGKKNIHSISAMNSIARHLNVDEKLVMDLASGGITDEDAYYEVLGYGPLEIDSKILEITKKDFFKRNASRWNRESEQDFRNQFYIDKQKILHTIEEIHTHIHFQEAPLYLPEITNHYSYISLEPVSELRGKIGELVKVYIENNHVKITYKNGYEMKPYVRFQIAKALSPHFLSENTFPSEFKNYQEHFRDVQSNIFACNLLAPESLIRKEIQSLDPNKDLLTQLAESFWMSKSFINLRLKDILSP